MSMNVKPLGAALRLEILSAPAPGVLVNMIPNPNGELGGWGWVTADPVHDQAFVEGYPNSSGLRTLHYAPAHSGPVLFAAQSFTSDLMQVAAGRYVAASWRITVAGFWHRARFEFVDADGALISSSAQGAYRGGPGATGTFSLAAVVAPALTAFVRLRFDLYADNTGGTPSSGNMWFNEVTVAQAPSGALLTNLPYVAPGPYVNILGTTHDVVVNREGLNVGTLTAHIVDSSLDPSQSDLIRPGRPLRLLARDVADMTWRPVFTGTTTHADVSYKLTRTNAAKRAEIELTAVDNVQKLGNQKRTEGVGTIAELPYVLSGCGVPWNVNGSGNALSFPVTVVSTNDNATALDQIAVTRDSTLGLAYVNRMGVLWAVDSAHRTATAVGELGESTYGDVGITWDSATLINEVTLHYLSYDGDTTTDVVYGPYRDEASIAAWGIASQDFTVQGITEDDATLTAYAQAILTANSTPVVRLNTMQLRAETNAAFTAIASWFAWLDLYDVVTITCARASMTSEPERIVSISHTISGPDSKWLIELGFNGTTRVALPTVSGSIGGGVTVAGGGGGGGGSSTPTGPAGGALTGTYPNPDLADNTVTSAKLADGTIVAADVNAANKDGTAATPSLRTLGTGAQQAAAGNDARLTNARTPTAHAATHQPGGSDAMAVDAAAATGSLRTLGTGATQAAAGNDARLSDGRPPSGLAGGDLGGTYPNPVIGSGKVTSAHIADGTIQNNDLADNIITGLKVIDGTLTDAEMSPLNVDGVAATPSLRTLGTGPQQAASGGHTHAGLAFYPDPTDIASLSTYNVLQTIPPGGVESSIATPLSGTGDVLVGAFITQPGVPGAVEYPAGTATRTIYAMTSAGTARLHLTIYVRNAAGVETLVRDEVSPDFTNTAVAAQQWSASMAAVGSVLASDRLVMKLYAQRVAGPANITVTTYFEGTAHTSMIRTTIAAGTPIGAAGGALTGTYPNPSLANDSVNSFNIIPGAVVLGSIADDAITADKMNSSYKDGLAATPSLRTLGAGAQQAAAGNDARLSNSRPPNGAAGGALTGTYPSPGLAAHATTHQPGGTDPLAVDAVAATGSLRTLGTGAQQAASGTDARFTNARTPTAHATTHQPGGSDPMSVDAVAATGSLRTLGSGAQQAAAGNDVRITGAASDALVLHRSGPETVLGTKTFDTPQIQTYQGSTPATPPAGRATGPYFRGDGLPYFLTPSGAEVPFSVGGTSGALHGNADFEAVSGVTPTLWSFGFQSNGSVATETADVLFGTRSLTVTVSAANGWMIPQSNLFIVAPGDTIEVGIWMRAVTLNPGVTFGLQTRASGTPNFFDFDTVTQGTDPIQPGSGWARYTRTFTVPLGHTVGRIWIRVDSTPSGGVAARIDATTSVKAAVSPTPVLPGNSWTKEACRVVDVGTSVPTSTAPATVDGIALAVGDRVLKAVPSGSANNGIWLVTTVGTGANGVWSRAPDAASPTQLAGAEVAALTGNTYAGTRWVTSFKQADAVGTTVMYWAQAGLTAVRDTLDSTFTIPAGSTSLATAAQASGLSVSIVVTSTTQVWLVELSIYVSMVANGTVVVELTVDGVVDSSRGSLVASTNAGGGAAQTPSKTYLLTGLSVGAHTLGAKGWQPGGTGQTFSATNSVITAWTAS